uniref:Uncharacterized protein n=1 Tax=Salix viminalis TaxID=40686 RepID=A0A6N2NLR3_SALVM
MVCFQSCLRGIPSIMPSLISLCYMSLLKKEEVTWVNLKVSCLKVLETDYREAPLPALSGRNLLKMLTTLASSQLPGSSYVLFRILMIWIQTSLRNKMEG